MLTNFAHFHRVLGVIAILISYRSHQFVGRCVLRCLQLSSFAILYYRIVMLVCFFPFFRSAGWIVRKLRCFWGRESFFLSKRWVYHIFEIRRIFSDESQLKLFNPFFPIWLIFAWCVVPKDFRPRRLDSFDCAMLKKEIFPCKDNHSDWRYWCT